MEGTSAEGTPRAPPILDQSSSTTLAAGESSSIHTPSSRNTDSHRCILDPSRRIRRRTKSTKNRRTQIGLLYTGRQNQTPPPRARQRRRSGAPSRRGRAREDLIPRWRRRRRLDAENLDLDTLGPNLHRQIEDHRSPTAPRARGLPETEGNGDLAGESTGRLSSASLNCSHESLRENWGLRFIVVGSGECRLTDWQHGLGLVLPVSWVCWV